MYPILRFLGLVNHEGSHFFVFSFFQLIEYKQITKTVKVKDVF